MIKKKYKRKEAGIGFFVEIVLVIVKMANRFCRYVNTTNK